MKKTLTVNLSGMVFHIDEDAYEMLNDYLSEVKRHFTKDESPEIMNDIEARIAELFTERMGSGRNVVNCEDVDAVIGILGKPNQFEEEGEEKEVHTEKAHTEKKKRKRFYRDPEGAMLGGVASGFAAYVNWDVTLVRILMIALVILGIGWFIPVYLVIWLVTPEAKTAAQRLEMQGEEPTLENIKNYLNSEQFKESASQMGSTLGRTTTKIANVIVKIFAVLITVVLMIVCITTLVGTIGVIVFTLVTGSAAVADAMMGMDVSTPLFIAAVTSMALTIIVPLAAITAGCIRLLLNKPVRRGNAWPWILLVVWIMSVTTLVTIVVTTGNRGCLSDMEDVCYGEVITEERQTDEFTEIKARNGIKVKVMNGDSCSVSLTGKEAVLKGVRCEVEDGQLNLSIERVERAFAKNRVTAIVTMPNVRMLSAESAAYIEAEDTIRTERLEAYSASAGKIDAIIVADKMVCSAASASVIKMDGMCKRMDSNAMSAAKMDFSDMMCDTVYASVASAAYTSVKGGWLNLTATSGGKIKYEGGEKMLYKNKANGGKIYEE